MDKIEELLFKQEKADISKRWAERNPEKANEASRRYSEKHPERRREARRRYNENHPERVREQNKRTHMRAKYNLSPADYNTMHERQGGKCANPGCDNPAKHIDHDHTTGEVRGLLCSGCNIALGHLREDKGRITGLITYLEKYGGSDG